jgi:hypothetical protein
MQNGPHPSIWEDLVKNPVFLGLEMPNLKKALGVDQIEQRLAETTKEAREAHQRADEATAKVEELKKELRLTKAKMGRLDSRLKDMAEVVHWVNVWAGQQDEKNAR